MRIEIVTIFPELVEALSRHGIWRLAIEKGLASIGAVDLREFTHNKHRQVDDEPYGGGAGMVMKPEPFWEALCSRVEHPLLLPKGVRTVLTTPQGRPLDQAILSDFAGAGHLVIICGRYEGVDERVRSMVSDEVSLGDFVLSGGEIAAMAIADGVVRLLEGAVGAKESLDEESFVLEGLEYPQYTRPACHRGMEVPPVLTSGNHAAVNTWRADQARQRTKLRRPDLHVE